jgi:hypothetical protein
MKTISIMLISLFVIGISFSRAQNITVQADKQLNTDFSKYKTFYWASQVDSKLDEGFYFLNDLILKTNVRTAIQSEMEGLGYKLQSTSPNLVVNFRVFDKPVTLKGYESYGVSYWSGVEMRDAADAKMYEVKAGTLLVTFVDVKTGQIVWQGFASGLINNNEFIKDEAKIKEAVNLIFDKYEYRAGNKYSVN